MSRHPSQHVIEIAVHWLVHRHLAPGQHVSLRARLTRPLIRTAVVALKEQTHRLEPHEHREGCDGAGETEGHTGRISCCRAERHVSIPSPRCKPSPTLSS